MNEKLFTCEEIAEALKVKITTVYKYIREGSLKAKKIGRMYRVTETEFKRFCGD